MKTLERIATVRILPARHNSLSRRLVVATLLVSAVVSVIVIAVQLYYAYTVEREIGLNRLDEIGQSIAPSIASSLWQVDQDRVNLLLDGIKRFPRVSYLELTTREGEQFVRGDPQADILRERSYPLLHEPGRYELGKLRVALGKRQLVESLSKQAASIALSTTVTLLSCTVLMLLLFRRWVTRHLVTMADYTRSLHLRDLDAPLLLNGKTVYAPPDELDQMVLAFNLMRETLARELELRDRDQAELMDHRERLETLVHRRTSELAEKSEQLLLQRDEMQRLANTDSLTGVSSRRHFNELFEHELARSKRSGEPLSLLMLDIDHFKRINDQFGHDVGDLAIIRCCVSCTGQLRQIDVIGRLGGEEFGILLPATDSAGAALVAERIRSTLSAGTIETAHGPLKFTVSVGVGTLSERRDNMEAILKGADEALYAAKHGGRDRVCLSS